MRHECFFSTASQQSYGIRRDFPEMSPAKAALTLQGELSSAIRKAVAFHECHEKGETPPRLVVRAPASLGKSSAILGELKRLFDDPETAKLRIGYFCPTLELCDELKEKAEAEGIPARVFRGRSALKPGQPAGGEQKMCGKSDVAEMLSAAGYSVADTLCQSRIPTGERDKEGKLVYEKVECPLAATCEYFKQMKDRRPGLILGSHAYLTTPIEALRQEHRLDIIIIDESFANEAAVNGRRVVLDRLLAPQDIPTNAARYKMTQDRDGKKRLANKRERERARDADVADLANGAEIVSAAMRKAIAEKREVRLEDILEFHGGEEAEASSFFGHLATLEYARLEKPEIHAGMPVEEQRDLASRIRARDTLAFAAFWKRLAKELSLRSEGSMNGIRWKWDELVGAGTPNAYVANCAYLYHPKSVKFNRIPVIVLDASANDRIIEQFFPEFEFVTMKVELPETVKICQVSDRTGSMRMYKESEKRLKEVYGFMQRLGKWVDQETRHLGDGKDRRPLFIGYKSLHEEKWLEEGLAVSLRGENGEQIVESADGSFFIAHANGIRGVDRWKDARAAVVGARMEPSPRDVENLTRAVFANVDREIGVGLQQYEREERVLAAKDGSISTVQVSKHSDEFCDIILRQIREEEMIQCLTRSRPIHRKEPLTIFLLSNIPLEGYEPNELFEWDEVMPDRFDRFALDPANDVIPDRLSDLAMVAAEHWPSYDAIKRAHARRRTTAPALYRLYSHGGEDSNLTKFGSNISVSGIKVTLSFNYLQCGNRYGDNSLYETPYRDMSPQETAPPLPGLDLGRHELRVSFRRHGSRGIRTAVVKLAASESPENAGVRLLRAFPDAYEIEIIGGLEDFMRDETTMAKAVAQLENLTDRAAEERDEMWWSEAVDSVYRIPTDEEMIEIHAQGIPIHYPIAA